MIELDDCGTEFHLMDDHGSFDATIQMVIKAPRGTMALFDYISYRQWHEPTEKFYKNQRDAIRAFMEEHQYDSVTIYNMRTKKEANHIASRMLRRDNG